MSSESLKSDYNNGRGINFSISREAATRSRQYLPVKPCHVSDSLTTDDVAINSMNNELTKEFLPPAIQLN